MNSTDHSDSGRAGVQVLPPDPAGVHRRAFYGGPTWKFDVVRPLKAFLKALRRVKDLTPVTIRSSLRAAKVVGVLVAKDEADRVPALLAHYRALGVGHFIFIDNESSDDLLQLLAAEVDVSVLRASGSYKAAHYGIDWVNFVLHRYCRGKWALVVDCDEYLVYDGSGRRSITSLTDVLQERGQRSLPALMIDMYADEIVATAARGDHPLDACPYYDAVGYLGRRDPTSLITWVKGGPRFRAYFDADWDAAPALNKVPLVRVGWATFLASAHVTSSSRLNAVEAGTTLTGALLHFRFLGKTGEKLTDSAVAREHTPEYDAYTRHQPRTLVTEASRRYASPDDLIEVGLITPFSAS